MKRMVSAVIGVTALCGLASFAQAQDEKTTANAALMISNVLRQPVDLQQRQLAFDESLRRDGPAPRRFGGEVQPDGSVRYGDLTVGIVKNPCPPGEHIELPSPPIRRASR